MPKRKSEVTIDSGEKQQKTLSVFSSLAPRELWDLILDYVPKQEYPLLRLTNKWSANFIQVKKFRGGLIVYYVDHKKYWIASLESLTEHYSENYDSDTLWNYLLIHVRFNSDGVDTIAKNGCIKTRKNLTLLTKIRTTTDKEWLRLWVICGLAQKGLKLLPKLKLRREHIEHYHNYERDLLISIFKSDNVECFKYYLGILLEIGTTMTYNILYYAIESGSLKAVVYVCRDVYLLTQDLGEVFNHCRTLAAYSNNIKMAKLVTLLCNSIDCRVIDDKLDQLKSMSMGVNFNDSNTLVNINETRPFYKKTNVSQDKVTDQEMHFGDEHRHITLENYEEIIALLPDHAFDIDYHWNRCFLSVSNVLVPGLHNASMLKGLTWSKHTEDNKPLSMEMVKFFFERPRLENIVVAFPNPADIYYDDSKRGRLLLDYRQINLFKFCYEVGYIQEESFFRENGFPHLINSDYTELFDVMNITEELMLKHTPYMGCHLYPSKEMATRIYTISPQKMIDIYKNANGS